jgi:hypothetical protein
MPITITKITKDVTKCTKALWAGQGFVTFVCPFVTFVVVGA